MSNTTITPSQVRYRDWKAPVGSKDSMESLAIMGGIGPKLGFDKVSAVFNTNVVATASNVILTIGHSNIDDNGKGRYSYIVDRLQTKRNIGGVVITPDAIVTEVDGNLVFSIDKTGDTFNTSRYSDINGDCVEVILVASHNYIEEDIGDGNKTSFRVILNNQPTSIRSIVGVGTSDEDNKSMVDWLSYQVVANNIDLTFESIVGLYVLCIGNPSLSKCYPVYDYVWPRQKNITQNMWAVINSELDYLKALPRTTCLALQSISAPVGQRWLDKVIGIGDIIEVCNTNSGNNWNEIRDVMSIFNTLGDINLTPIIQVLFSSTEYPWLLRVVKLTATVWSVEYFKGNVPVWKYLTKTYNQGEILKVDIRNNSLISDEVVYDLAGAPNIITLHTLYTFANGIDILTDRLKIWATSSNLVGSNIACHLLGTYTLSTNSPTVTNLDYTITIPSGMNQSGPYTIDDMASVDGVITPYTIGISTLTPEDDEDWTYEINPTVDNQVYNSPLNLSLVLDTRTEFPPQREAGSYFLCPTNTVMTGRYHEDDENGATKYEYATLKAVDANGNTVAGTISVTNVVWGDWFPEQSGNGFLASSGRVLVGRQHVDDENGATKYATAIIKFNGNDVTIADAIQSNNFRESDAYWFKTDANRVLVGRHHSGDETGDTYYTSSKMYTFY